MSRREAYLVLQAPMTRVESTVHAVWLRASSPGSLSYLVGTTDATVCSRSQAAVPAVALHDFAAERVLWPS
jgi:hypothetical protein